MSLSRSAIYLYKEALSITPDDDSLRAKVVGLEESERGVFESVLSAIMHSLRVFSLRKIL